MSKIDDQLEALLKAFDDEENNISLKLENLEAEIEEVKHLKINNKKVAQHRAYIKALESQLNLIKKNIVKDLMSYTEETYCLMGVWIVTPKQQNGVDLSAVARSAVSNSPFMKLIEETTALLRKLGYQPATQQRDCKHIINYRTTMMAYYEEKKEEWHEMGYKDSPGINFLRGVTSTVFASIGFVLGVGIGAVYGFLDGLKYCGVGSLITTPYFAITEGMDCAEAGNKFGKWLTGAPPYSSTIRSLFFCKSPLQVATSHVVTKANKFVGQEEEQEKSYSQHLSYQQ